ncbi:hypothetical protein D9M71_673300 [compost metagenome]
MRRNPNLSCNVLKSERISVAFCFHRYCEVSARGRGVTSKLRAALCEPECQLGQISESGGDKSFEPTRAGWLQLQELIT